jgi:hypothetical protein
VTYIQKIFFLNFGFDFKLNDPANVSLTLITENKVLLESSNKNFLRQFQVLLESNDVSLIQVTFD